MATQIAAELLTCTNMQDVHRLAMRLRKVGRSCVVALNEEHRIRGVAGDGPSISAEPGPIPSSSGLASVSPEDGPSTSAGLDPSVPASVSPGDGPSTSAGPEPSTFGPASDLPRDGPSTFTGVGTSTSTSVPTNLPSIDDYTVIMEDMAILPSHDLELCTPTLPLTRLVQPSPKLYVRRKKARPRYQPEMEADQVQLQEPLGHAQAKELEVPLNQPQGTEQSSQPTEPPIQPQLVERRRNPKRTLKIPSCGTG